MAQITTVEAARRLGVTRSTVQVAARAGMFPGAVQVGRQWNIPEEALAGFVVRGKGRPKKNKEAEG